jgi:hypothetical protein
MANTYSDLTATTVAANYNVASPSNALGTRVLRYLKVTAVHSSNPVDFSKAILAGTGSYTAASSLWANAIRSIQGFAEVYIYYTPGTAGFMVVVSDDTAQDSDTNTNLSGGYGDMELAIKDACGIDTSVTVATVSVAAGGITIS